MTALSPFDEVIRDLAQAQHLPRVKKLLVYTCTQRWESDSDRLAQFDLHRLIETLMQLAPTLEQLHTYLEQVTQTLSKPAEYRLIANMIVQHLRKLYVGPVSLSRLNTNPHLFWQIAQTLELDADHLRIRKLLILICRNYWESDSDRLLAITLPDLIVELHQLTQSPTNLAAVLASVVQTTSKPAQYGAIAQRIIKAFDLLYAEPSENATEIRSAPASPATSPTFITEPPAPREAEAGSTSLPAPSSPSLTREESAPITVIEPYDVPAAEVSPAVPSAPVDPLQIPKFNRAELFDLRLEIMKYTIPLLAKQLMFLTLFSPPGRLTEEQQTQVASDPDTWIALKSRDFDDLIEGILQQSPTVSQLEQNLQFTAQALSHDKHYGTIAHSIVRSVKTLIAKHQIYQPIQTPLAHPSANSSDGTRKPHSLAQALPHQRTQADAHTCQMFSSTVSFDKALPPLAAPLSPQQHEIDPIVAIAQFGSQPQPASPKSAAGQIETELLPAPEASAQDTVKQQPARDDTPQPKAADPLASTPDKTAHLS